MQQFFLLAALALPAAPVPAPVADPGLPTPPHQKLPWTPPKSDVPETFVTAAAKLFDLGLADPRGCEYRAVTLHCPSRWTDDPVVRTNAWVLPGGIGARRFAVCWDGLVYPVSEVGAPADLTADIRAAVKRHDQNAADHGLGANGWRQSDLYKSDLPKKHDSWLAETAVALLLRLGEGAAADDLWKTSRASGGPDEEDHYVVLADEWTTRLFERGLIAFLSGDDRFSLANFQALTSADRAIGAELKARDWRPKQDNNRRAFQFRDQLPALTADLKRRAATFPRKPIVCFGPGRHPDRAVRISALIDRLDDVSGGQWVYPGGAYLAGSLVVQALEHEGADAVEAVLKEMRADTRLTRTIEFGQDYWPGTVQGVSKPLMEVLKHSDFYPTGQDVSRVSPDDLITAVRARLARPEANLPLAERWFHRLADDEAGSDEWCRAAEALTEKEGNGLWSSDTANWQGLYRPQFPLDDNAKLVGESLRNRASPTLSALLSKRVGQATDVELSARLAFSLAKWGLDAAKPILAQLTSRCRGGKAATFLKLVSIRADAGDTDALNEFASWIATAAPKELWPSADPFELMIKYGDHPAIAKVADQLFGDPKSPWQPAGVTEEREMYRTSIMTSFGLLRFPSFRATIAEMLGDKTVIGTVKVEDWQIDIHKGNRTEGRSLSSADAPAGYEGPVRLCDYVADRSSTGVIGAPRFELYWPEARRDATVAAMAEFLRDHGPLIRGYGRRHAWVAFPQRKQPATRAEAAKHDAVFSLEGLGPTRIVDLPQTPTAGKWVTHRDLPIRQRFIREGKLAVERGFFQDGFIVQAEEVQINGRWQRYYGFEGANRIAKVPAQEIEFVANDYYRYRRWLRFTGKFEARLAPPKGMVDPDELGPPRRLLGKSIPVRLTVRNAAALPESVPDFSRHIQLKAWYSPAIIARQGMLVPAADQDAGWHDVAAKAGEFSQVIVGRKLNPGEELTIADIDLSAWFDLNRPGFYRVRLTTTEAADVGGEPIVFSLGTPRRP
jgi:hypothetical protein